LLHTPNGDEVFSGDASFPASNAPPPDTCPHPVSTVKGCTKIVTPVDMESEDS
jgi:hypothetical protein